jgi:NTP pyrophosphatase (non-canonical NTP hydrolase)
MEYRDQINKASKNTSKAMINKGFYEDDEFIENLIAYIEKDACEIFLPIDAAAKLKSIWERNRKLARIALIHSELSEMVEGVRKDSMDDKLPHRKMEEVELADTLIRIEDYAGAYDLDLGGARDEKEAYNFTRPYKHGKCV